MVKTMFGVAAGVLLAVGILAGGSAILKAKAEHEASVALKAEITALKVANDAAFDKWVREMEVDITGLDRMSDRREIKAFVEKISELRSMKDSTPESIAELQLLATKRIRIARQYPM